MQMDAGLDTGDILLVEALPIASSDTTTTLHDRLAALGGTLIVQALARAANGTLVRSPQPAEGVSYARKIDKAEAPIDWREEAALIERRIRAFDPFPGASAVLGGEAIKCWHADLAGGHGEPGEIIAVSDDAITVACGSGALHLMQLQRAGGKRLTTRAFMQSTALQAGMRFEPRAD
jgi:methionyl-tRNA formyltransferase